MPKLMVLGYGRHGKDTACEILAEEYGLSFVSSSLFCAEHVIMPACNGRYKTVEECYADRHNYREFWYQTISEYNTPDKTHLGRAIFKKYDIYCGIRNVEELRALEHAGVFDYSIWIDRSRHLPRESNASCTVRPYHADFIINNNGPIEDLRGWLINFMETWVI